MFDLFGAEMPLAVRFFLAFLIVLGLIGVTAWVVRRFGGGRLSGASSRGRQPRLAVIDHASVDGRRRLILVRRDNVEHLLMVGGPTDVVVESNIVRAVATPRDIPVARPPGTVEALPRAIPLPDNGNGSWPLQPEPIPAPARPAPRIEPLPEEPAAWPLQPHADTPKRPQRETLAALADELTARPAPPRNRAPANPRPQPQPMEARAESKAEPRIEPRGEAQGEPQTESEPEPRVEARSEARSAAAQIEAADAAAADQSLAEMAHRLEAALRKTTAPAEPRQTRMPATPAAPAPAPQSAPLRNVRPPEPKPARADAKPAQGKTLYDSLEQEMASLLGRPTNKT